MTTRVPREFINELLNRTDVVDLIDARVPLRKKSNNNFFACCPFHSEKSASFSVSQHKQFYYCFGCGAHGNALDFLMQFDRLSFLEAVDVLAKQNGMEVPAAAAHFAKPAADSHLYDLLQRAAHYYQNELRKSPQAIDYLKKRGLSGAVAKEFKIGFAPAGWDHLLTQFGTTPLARQHLLEAGMLIKKDDGGHYDRFRERIMFPILDRRGRTIGFGGRILDKGEPKYLNSPETPIFQKGHELYGLYQALQANRTLARAIIVEGYMDAIALFSHDITEAVATLGTATTSSHITHLARYTSNLIFCFDGDAAGRTAAWRALLVALPLMRDDLQIKFMFLPDGEDPDSLVRKQGKMVFEQTISHALTLSQFFFRAMSAQSDLSSMDGRARFVKLATEHLNLLPPGALQQMMFAELAKRAQMDLATLTSSPEKKVAQPRRRHLKARPPSTVRLAISLLVQNPALAQTLPGPLPDLDIPGHALLNEIVIIAQQFNTRTTGELVEHWRDRPDEGLLIKLAQIEHMMPTEGIQTEFLGAINKLKKFAKEQTIKQLLHKAASQELALEDKKLLTELINSKDRVE